MPPTRYKQHAKITNLAPLEHDEQAAVFGWADLMASQYPELALLYAIPNGAKLPYRKVTNTRTGKVTRYSPEANKLIAEGLKKGVPDQCLPVSRKGYHGLYVELKRINSGKLSEEQKWWLDRLAEQGYLAVACWGAQEEIEVLSEYLDIK